MDGYYFKSLPRAIGALDGVQGAGHFMPLTGEPVVASIVVMKGEIAERQGKRPDRGRPPAPPRDSLDAGVPGLGVQAHAVHREYRYLCNKRTNTLKSLRAI
ncbi:hypothetical protein EVAR_68141_1 [Eumeta japonica]|uniref:Uncharacterized protein n=1 Tax=Eumeta variegata TaxID=151549 RepID=A0A4C2A3W3_EUMVA|nr:hypothetical protein EVAR_68141_1 [Eumeta japonica]